MKCFAFHYPALLRSESIDRSTIVRFARDNTKRRMFGEVLHTSRLASLARGRRSDERFAPVDNRFAIAMVAVVSIDDLGALEARPDRSSIGPRADARGLLTTPGNIITENFYFVKFFNKHRLTMFVCEKFTT